MPAPKELQRRTIPTSRVKTPAENMLPDRAAMERSLAAIGAKSRDDALALSSDIRNWTLFDIENWTP